MEGIMQLADKYNLYVIEDTAQALGAEYTFSDGRVEKVGTIGHAGTTSFFPSKNLGCYGDGGAIFTNGEDLSKKLRSIVNHGMKVRYYHDNVGVNSRLDTIQAAILDVKLKHLNTYNQNRRKAADYYDKAFENSDKIQTPQRFEHSNHIFHQYTLVLNGVDRDGLQNHLKEKGIASAVYYTVPLHLQEAYKSPRYKAGDFPVTEHLSKSVMSLPIHTEMTEEDLKYITDSVLEYINK